MNGGTETDDRRLVRQDGEVERKLDMYIYTVSARGLQIPVDAAVGSDDSDPHPNVA